MTEIISPELLAALRRLKLGRMCDTLPQRLTLARQQSLPYQDFLLLALSDEVERRDRTAAVRRATAARLDPNMRLDLWDQTAKVTFDQRLWAELCALRFVEQHYNALILGPVGVGKTFMANALGHLASQRRRTVRLLRADQLFKELKISRLDGTYDREMRRLIGVDVLIIDDFGLSALDGESSRDQYDLVIERHRRASTVITSNRDPSEWLALMADPIRAQSAIDRLKNAAFELVVDGEPYRERQKPTIDA
jgi:DNA replication protein DnaC